MAKLTEKQELFVQEYLIDLNATQAAIRAGYSENTAYSIGNENLKKPEIVERIHEAMRERLERTHVTQDMVLSELVEVGFAKKNAVNGIRLKMSDKLKALDMLGRHMGMFQDKQDDHVPVTVVVNYDYGEDD